MPEIRETAGERAIRRLDQELLQNFFDRAR